VNRIFYNVPLLLNRYALTTTWFLSVLNALALPRAACLGLVEAGIDGVKPEKKFLPVYRSELRSRLLEANPTQCGRL
jgi:hypothetical protein